MLSQDIRDGDIVARIAYSNELGTPDISEMATIAIAPAKISNIERLMAMAVVTVL